MKFSTTVLLAATAVGSASAFSTSRMPSLASRSALFSSTLEKEETSATMANGVEASAEAKEEVKQPEPVAAVEAAATAPKYQADIPGVGGTFPGAPTLATVDKSKIQP
jgi:hypothetical protein